MNDVRRVFEMQCSEKHACRIHLESSIITCIQDRPTRVFDSKTRHAYIVQKRGRIAQNHHIMFRERMSGFNTPNALASVATQKGSKCKN